MPSSLGLGWRNGIPFPRHFPFDSLNGGILASNGHSRPRFSSGRPTLRSNSPSMPGQQSIIASISRILALPGYTSPVDWLSSTDTPMVTWDGPMPEARNQAEDSLRQRPLYGHLGRLECGAAPETAIDSLGGYGAEGNHPPTGGAPFASFIFFVKSRSRAAANFLWSVSFMGGGPPLMRPPTRRSCIKFRTESRSRTFSSE